LLHVDDIMIACEDRKGLDYVMEGLNSNYTKANVCEGSVLDYLGMIFDYSIPGEVTISMLLLSSISIYGYINGYQFLNDKS
jgi:hypothetical protein